MELKKIFLIDDNPATNLINRRFIEKTGCKAEIKAFTSARAALDYLQMKDEKGNYPLPEVIFLDLNMPQISGWGFLDLFRQLPPACTKDITPYILTTSGNKNDEQKAKEYPELGGYIQKPLSKVAFTEILEKWITA